MRYLSIKEGEFKETSEESNPNAKRRDYTTKTGEEKTKFEIPSKREVGVISNIVLKEVEFPNGKVKFLEVTFNDTTISMSVESRHAKDFMSKLPSIDITLPVELAPYDFVPKGKIKSLSGLTVYQSGGKVGSYYSDSVRNPDGTYTGTSKNGMPEPEEAVKDFNRDDSDDWKMYFTQVKKFLVKETEAFIAKNIPEEKQEIKLEDIPVVDLDKVVEEEININDII